MSSKIKIDQFNDLTSDVEGFFNDLSISIFDLLMTFQERKGIKGNLVEIGAWHGKSAAMLGVHASEGESVFIFDLEVRDELVKTVNRLTNELARPIKLIKANSFTKITPDFCNEHYRKVRWVHIDGDHSEYGIYNDMVIANSVLHPMGVLVIDDFLNERFPQISEVAFEFSAVHKHELCLVLSGGNKGYFVRPKFRDIYYQYLRDGLESELLNYGLSAKLYFGSHNGCPSLGIRRD